MKILKDAFYVGVGLLSVVAAFVVVFLFVLVAVPIAMTSELFHNVHGIGREMCEDFTRWLKPNRGE